MPRTPRDKSPKGIASLVPKGPAEDFPTKLAPMLATPFDEPFTRPGWLHELKLDGYRVLAFVLDGKVTLRSRRSLDLTKAFPEITAELVAQPLQPLILDGEIVVFENGKPSFNGLQNRAQLKLERQIADARKRLPAVFFAFDILHVAGVNVRGLPYEERRSYFAGCVHPQTHVQLVHAEEDGIALYDASVAMGLEGTIAKRADSTYESGKRSLNWLTIGEGARAPAIALAHCSWVTGRMGSCAMPGMLAQASTIRRWLRFASA